MQVREVKQSTFLSSVGRRPETRVLKKHEIKLSICVSLDLLLFWTFKYCECGRNVVGVDGTTAPLSVGKLRASADQASTSNDFDLSLKLWAIIGMEPSNDVNYYKRFRIYLKQQKYKEALSDLNQVLSLKPSNDAALSQRGKLQMKMGRCVEAEADFQSLQR